MSITFYDKYRPATITELCGHESTKKRLESLSKSVGLSGQSYFIKGLSGTGKTTLARIIAGMVSDPLTTTEIDAQDVSLELLRDWETTFRSKPLFGDGYCLIVNECHLLSTRAVSRLQTVLEGPAQKNCTFLFTTTLKGQKQLFDTRFDSLPFLSRCIAIDMSITIDDVHAMAERLREIAQLEQLDGRPVEDYVDLLSSCKFNMRQCLQNIACGDMLDGSRDAR